MESGLRATRRALCLAALAIAQGVAVSPGAGQAVGVAGSAEAVGVKEPSDGGGTQSPLRLSLGDAARLAARQSETVVEAQAQGDAADARVVQSRAALLPSLSFSGVQGQRTFNTASFGISFSLPGGPPLFNPNGEVLGPVETVDARGTVRQTLFDLSAWKRLSSSKSSARASRAQADAVAEAAAARGAAAYLAALRAAAVEQARSQDLGLAQDLLAMARRLLQAGVGVALDVTRAEAQVAEMRAQLIRAQNNDQLTHLALRRALGVSLDMPLELKDSLATLPTNDSIPSVTVAVNEALARRPDVRASERRIDAASQQVSAIKAERLPALSLEADDGYFGKDYTHMLGTYDWAIQVSIPVFDGLRRRARTDEARAQEAVAEANRRDLGQEVTFEVRSALLGLSSAHQQVDAAAEHLRLAQQELDQARERFHAGVAGNADVVTASLGLNQARTEYINALASYQAARVDLARATGTVRTLP